MRGASKLLISEEPLVVLPTLAKLVGLHEAIFLQQLHYRLRRASREEDGLLWVRRTYEEWITEMPWFSDSTVKRVIASLREKGLLLVRSDLNTANFDRTNWYSLDYDAFEDLLPSAESDSPSGQIDPMDGVNLTPCDQVNLTPPIVKEKKIAKEASQPQSISANGGGDQEAEMAAALVRETYAAVGKFAPSTQTQQGRDILGLAFTLLDSHGWKKCSELIPLVKERNLNNAREGKKPIGSPLHYLNAILEETLAAAPPKQNYAAPVQDYSIADAIDPDYMRLDLDDSEPDSEEGSDE